MIYNLGGLGYGKKVGVNYKIFFTGVIYAYIRM
jgi:hypothetical protein